MRYAERMRPFRDPPRVELGPVRVGLAEAAERAIARLPRGGLLRSRRPGTFAPHTLGALGSAGVVLVAGAAFVAATSVWQPDPWMARGVVVALVLAGGLSLALLLRAMDRAAGTPLLRGELVGRAARRTLARVARLAVKAERAPDRFGARRIRALSGSLSAARDADVAPWIPADVRGRAELLLARAIAAQAGPRWSEQPPSRARVEDLLRSAADHLLDPAPARADLDALAARPPATGRHVARIPDWTDPDEAEREAEEAERPRPISAAGI